MYFPGVMFLVAVLFVLPLIDGFPEQTKWADQTIDFENGTQNFFHAVLANNTEV